MGRDSWVKLWDLGWVWVWPNPTQPAVFVGWVWPANTPTWESVVSITHWCSCMTGRSTLPLPLPHCPVRCGLLREFLKFYDAHWGFSFLSCFLRLQHFSFIKLPLLPFGDAFSRHRTETHWSNIYIIWETDSVTLVGRSLSDSRERHSKL